MQRISFRPSFPIQLLSLCLLFSSVLSKNTESKPSSFLEQAYQQTTSGDIVIADMDDFADWLYQNNGDNYQSRDDFRLYRVTQNPPQTTDFVLDFDDYTNPGVARYQSFIDVSSAQNPLNRDQDELPDNPNDIGRDHRKGDMSWLLVSSFISGQSGTGKIWAVPRNKGDRDDAFVLIGGLQTPTGVCFDNNHDFLYVCDPAQNSIYQYTIDWDGKSRFVLDGDVVATIMQNVTAQDCSVDAYGNLYYVDSLQNLIGIVGYLDLWAGYIGQNRTLYQAEGDAALISSPVAIDVFNSETIYFINNVNASNAGLLVSAATGSASVNSGEMTVEVREDRTSWGVAASSRFVYFSNSDGSIWMYRISGSANLFLKSSGFFNDPRGLCYGDGRVYVADFDIGEVFYFEDSRREEEDPNGFVRLEGAYALECING